MRSARPPDNLGRRDGPPSVEEPYGGIGWRFDRPQISDSDFPTLFMYELPTALKCSYFAGGWRIFTGTGGAGKLTLFAGVFGDWSDRRHDFARVTIGAQEIAERAHLFHCHLGCHVGFDSLFDLQVLAARAKPVDNRERVLAFLDDLNFGFGASNTEVVAQRWRYRGRRSAAGK